MTNRKLTLKAAAAEARAHGWTLRRTIDSEVVVYPLGTGQDAPEAYFTDDLEDALGTMHANIAHMRRQAVERMQRDHERQLRNETQPFETTAARVDRDGRRDMLLAWCWADDAERNYPDPQTHRSRINLVGVLHRLIPWWAHMTAQLDQRCEDTTC